jgi:hypothetical protein
MFTAPCELAVPSIVDTIYAHSIIISLCPRLMNLVDLARTTSSSNTATSTDVLSTFQSLLPVAQSKATASSISDIDGMDTKQNDTLPTTITKVEIIDMTSSTLLQLLEWLYCDNQE